MSCLGQVRQVGGVADCREGIYGLCVDHKGVVAVKRETDVNPNHSQVLEKCTLLSCVHDAIHLRAQQDECNGKNILKLELVLFCLTHNVSTNN
jgi:hypothetical protein